MHTDETQTNAEQAQVETLPEEDASAIDAVAAEKERYDNLYDQFLRLTADFDNFRKRQAQEQLQLRQYGSQKALEALLPVLDNLERAATGLSEQSDPKLLYQSFRMLQNQLAEALKDLGLEKLDSVGQLFDPKLHEALNQVETTEHPEQTIVAQQQAGYQYRDRLLRPALVSVAVAPASVDKAAADDSVVNPFSQTL